MLRIGRAVIVATLLVAPAAWAQGPGSTFGAIVGGASLSDIGGDYGGTTGSRARPSPSRATGSRKAGMTLGWTTSSSR